MSDISFDNIDWNRLGDPAYLASLGVAPGSSQPPPAAVGPTTVGGLSATATTLSGTAIVRSLLRDLGLDITTDLDAYITNLTTKFGNNEAALTQVVTADQFDTSSTLGKVIDQKYPELAVRAKNGYAPMSVGEAISYRKTANQLAQAEGFPTNLLDFKDLIGNNKGLPEVQSRIHDAYGVLRQANPEAVDQLHTLYGLAPGQIAALAFDPTLTVADINRRYDAARVGAAGVRTGYGQLDRSQLEQLAAQGVTADQAQVGFGKLAQQDPLFTPLPGEGGAGITQAQQLAAQFGGSADAQKAIEDVRARRKAALAGGGGFGAGQSGIGGLGSAAST